VLNASKQTAIFINPCTVNLSWKQQWSWTVYVSLYVESQQYETARTEEMGSKKDFKTQIYPYSSINCNIC